MFKLLTKKLAYPHDYIDSEAKYNEIQLPFKEKFYSSLNDEHVDDGEYHYTQEIHRKTIENHYYPKVLLLVYYANFRCASWPGQLIFFFQMIKFSDSRFGSVQFLGVGTESGMENEDGTNNLPLISVVS